MTRPNNLCTLRELLPRAATCNLVEEGEVPLPHEAQSVRLPLAPFEIATVKVWF